MISITEMEMDDAELIDRRLLHKNEENEVFLSFCHPVTRTKYIAHALLHQHHYYNDHARTLTDLMNLLECARQAETYIVHKYEQQPLDTRFILTEWACNFTESFIPTTDMSDHYVSLKITTNNTRRVKKRLLSQSYDMGIYQCDNLIANVSMSVKYITSDAYCIVRKDKVRSYSSQPVTGLGKTTMVIPERVFRREKQNVVVETPSFHKERVLSKLAVNMANTAYFDHAQDHYPAMVLMEAGKQNCQLWIYKFKATSFPVLIEMKSQFFIYAELDKDVEIISVKIPGISDNKIMFNVSLKQGGVKIAEMQYSFKLFNLQ